MTPFEKRNKILAETVIKNFEKRGFAAYYCADKNEALSKAVSLIDSNDVVAWGGSMTISEIGLLDAVREKFKVIDRDKAANAEEKFELMRQGLLSDTFLMSSNAVTEDGQLVNIDGTGNRCAALIYGPRQVIVIAGVNKIVKTVEDAVSRARNIAAPVNAHRFEGLNTPCQMTGTCCNCLSDKSICNQFVVTRRCNPKGRIKVIIVGENLGY